MRYILYIDSNDHFLFKKIALLALGIILCCPALSQAYTGVTIILSAPSQVYLEFVDHFREELILTKNTTLRVKVIDLRETKRPVVAENSELVIALGVKALEAASKLKYSTPVLGLYTPLPNFNSLLAASGRDLGNFSAIFLDQPYSRQLLLIKTLLPDVKNVGLMLGKTSSKYNKLIRDAGEKKAINISIETINQESELIPKLQKLLKNNDALMAIPDPLVYSRETAQTILLTTYQHQKPVFGYSQSYVRAGALAAVYSKTKQYAKQAAEIAVKTQAAPGLLPPPQTPRYFSLSINYQVARSLNVILADKERLYKKLLEAEAAQNE
jgi:hypothetical protein